MRRTVHENRFSEEEITRRKLLVLLVVGMKRLSPALRTSLHLMKTGCLATKDKAPSRGRKKRKMMRQEKKKEKEAELK